MRKALATLLASALIATPLAANPSALGRSSQGVTDGSDLAANSNLFFIIGIVAVAAGIVLLQEDEEGAPVSA